MNHPFVSLVWGSSMMLVGAMPAIAQRSVATSQPDVDARVEARAASALLERPVTVDMHRVSVKRAIDVLARSAKVPIQYQEVLLDAFEAPVSLRLENAPLRIALDRVLSGTTLRVIPDGPTRLVIVATSSIADSTGIIAGRVIDATTKQPVRGATIVLDDATRGVSTGDDGAFRLATARAGSHRVAVRRLGYARQARTIRVVEGQTVTVDFVLDASANALDQVVVTGTVVATQLKAVPNAITVITAKDIEQRGVTRIDQLFRGDVPGVFAQNQGSYNSFDTTSMTVRGSTRLFETAGGIKTYVDGVELTSPGFLRQIDPRSIERIEILTGPQASTIYGSNALAGVMQIFTKRGTTSRPQLTATVLNGWIQNNYTPTRTPQHDYSAQLSGLEGRMAYNVGGTWTYTGPWTPASRVSQLGTFGGARLRFGGLTVDPSIRLSRTQNRNLGGAVYDVIQELVNSGRLSRWAYAYDTPPTEYNTIGETRGLSLGYAAGAWSQELVIGTDVNTTQSRSLAPSYRSVYDTQLQYSQTEARRMSMRYTTTARVPIGSVAQATATVGVDGWNTLINRVSANPSSLTGNLAGASVSRQPGHNTGGFVQGQAAFWDALFVTYGLRAEWNPNYGADVLPNYAPRYGAVLTRDVNTLWGPLTVKVRSSYGRSTRPPDVKDKLASPNTQPQFIEAFGPFDNTLANPDLGPETQQGVEGGLELYFGDRASFVLTRYNNTVDNLMMIMYPIDSVRSLKPCDGWWCGNLDSDGYGYAKQSMRVNAASIRNQGWEAQGMMGLGPIAAKGTYTYSKSRVLGVTDQYRRLVSGSYPYRRGSMLWFTPEHTWMLSATYGRARTSVSINVNGVGQSYRYGMSDPMFLEVICGDCRLLEDRARTDDPRGNLSAGRVNADGYATVDLNATHQFARAVDGVLQVLNLSNYYRNDFSVRSAVMGRQTRLGLRVRW